MTKFKIVKFTYGCASCSWTPGRLPIVKFEASIAKFGIGTKNSSLECPVCQRKRFYNVDTWWGGVFDDKAIIYTDTAKRKKLNVSEIPDVTDSLLKNRALTLKQEVNVEKKKFESVSKKLEELNAVLSVKKGKKKNGQNKSKR